MRYLALALTIVACGKAPQTENPPSPTISNPISHRVTRQQDIVVQVENKSITISTINQSECAITDAPPEPCTAREWLKIPKARGYRYFKRSLKYRNYSDQTEGLKYPDLSSFQQTEILREEFEEQTRNAFVMVSASIGAGLKRYEAVVDFKQKLGTSRCKSHPLVKYANSHSLKKSGRMLVQLPNLFGFDQLFSNKFTTLLEWDGEDFAYPAAYNGLISSREVAEISLTSHQNLMVSEKPRKAIPLEDFQRECRERYERTSSLDPSEAEIYGAYYFYLPIPDTAANYYVDQMLAEKIKPLSDFLGKTTPDVNNIREENNIYDKYAQNVLNAYEGVLK